MIERRPISAEDRRRNKVIRITEGMRRAIIGDPEYRRGRKVDP